MTEPQWIEHDGSAGCPVLAGSDCEVMFRSGPIRRDTAPERWRWGRLNGSSDITHYRLHASPKTDIEKALATLTAAGYSVTPPEPTKRMVRITIDVPEPLMAAPKHGSDYFAASFAFGRPMLSEWYGEEVDSLRLAAGVCYANAADAQAFLDGWAKRTVVPLGDV